MNTEKKCLLILLLVLAAIPMMGRQDTIMIGYGETFETIANRYGITLDELLKANPGKVNCYAGMRIAVPRPQESPVGNWAISSPAIHYADSLLLLAKNKSTAGDYKKAIKIYNQVIGMNVRSPYAYAGRGECYYRLGKYKKAAADLNHAIYSDELAEIERTWCKSALEDVEEQLEARRQRRNEVWANIGLAAASAAAIATTAYVASEQARMQQQSYRSPYPAYAGSGSSGLQRADQIIAQSNANINQMMARQNAQLNMMTQQTMMQAQQSIEDIKTSAKEEMQWRSEFIDKNGREPTLFEADQWYAAHYPHLMESRLLARGQQYSGESSADSEEKADEYKGELSPDQYLAHYRKWEQYAESAVNNLTSGGIKVKDDDGNIKGIANYHSVNGIGYTGNQRSLRDCQNQMRRIRLEAAKYGVNIPESKWETATVRY